MKNTIIVVIFVLLLGIGFLSIIISDNLENNRANIVNISHPSIAYFYNGNNGSLSGYITDPSMNPIEGANIRITCGGLFMQDFSNSIGFYHIGNIPIVDCYWNVSASSNGYETSWIWMSIDISTQDFILTPLSDVYFYVDDDAPSDWYDATHVKTIQEGINKATIGDTVFVYNGKYFENIVLDKSINLIGENKNITIIDGDNKGCTITLTSENAIIKNFTIIGGGFDTDDFINFFRAGIRITGSNNTICNNMFRKNRLGISGVRVTNLTIKDNIFLEDGIGFTSYENDGRPLMKMKYFLHNIENNTVNGKPVYYLINEKNKRINNWQIGQLFLVNCTNIRITNVSISNTDWGIVFAFSNNCSTEHCNLFNNSLAIWTLDSSNNVFQFNNISNNYHRGVVIDYNSNSNKIKYNTVSTSFCGVEIEWWSNANLITKNNFLNNNVSGFEHQSFFSIWYNNYYDDWIGLRKPLFFFFPKLIYGMPIEIIPRLTMPVSIDFLPAKEPYDIM
jgi:parallel beta-helix repeat protein